ncbi:MAG: DMT family transporter [Bacteroidales bacterium]
MLGLGFVDNHIGELAALLTACFWTVTSLAFEFASRKVGSLPVNIIRLVAGFIFLSLFTLIRRGLFLPTDASSFNWKWLMLSGLIGFVFGDLFLFKSYTLIGSRFSMMIMNLVPPFTAFAGFLILGERLSLFHFLGMLLTVTGISLAIFSRKEGDDRISLKLSPRGVLYAIGGAVGQALGLVLSKMGMKDYDPFAATQIRIIAGISGYIVLVCIMSRWNSVELALKNKKAFGATTLGAFFGPFLGVSFSLVAVKFTAAGIASTIMALVPVFILVPAVILFKQRVTLREIIGAIISVAGVALFFI